MKYKIYTNRKADNTEAISNSIGKSIVIDSASTFYAQLENACSENIDWKIRNEILRNVFHRVIEQSIINCKIAFVGTFAKLDYCIKEFNIPSSIANLIQQSRKEMFPEHNRKSSSDEEALIAAFPHHLKATALLVYYLCKKEEIPASLKVHFPLADRKSTWGKFDDNVIRVITLKWDDNYIWATEEENSSTIQICYGKDNAILTRDGAFSWTYLSQILWEGAQLNLVRIRKDERGEIYLPELIILEPDYLINITTVASCFESYAESPFVNLINKLKPQSNTLPIHLGNLAGQFLDDTIHGKNISFEDSIRSFISSNALNMISCPEIASKFEQFKNDAKVQRRNIEKLIGEDLQTLTKDYDKSNVLLEPAFFSEVLGIQGRLDFLHMKDNDVTIIEQKSGKGEFVRFTEPGYDPNVPKAKENHTVQILLYRALFIYEHKLFAHQVKHIMLLYSKYTKGLLLIPQSPDLLLRAIRIRNLLAWCEIMYAKEGLDILRTLTPEMLNQKKLSGKIWDQYIRPQLAELLNPIKNASQLEVAYYLRFMRFIENELLLAKVGCKMKENSGFASVWHDTLEDKKAAGNIYDELTITDFGLEGSAVATVTLAFKDKVSADATNFRIGDIIILYPYMEGEVPDACAQMVNRGSIVDIKEDNILIRLRNSQTDRKVFDAPEGTQWAIEHDMYESSTGSLYSGMHSFLSTTKRRRDLILLQREPEVDTTVTIKGEYGKFNTLVTRAKQARDMFLIIGPPGTGKTSFGLVNLLKEELLEPDTNVLLVSYTNRAVDEICSKLVEIKEEDPSFDFIRIGSDLSCSEEYRDFLLSSRTDTAEGGNGLLKLIKGVRVFCGTTAALNANISLFKIKKFSLAIVDESSQILEPHLMGLLSTLTKEGEEAIKRFILIGDHKQLPAVVQQTPDESAVNEPELNEIYLTDCRLSLFERLLLSMKTADGYDERFVYMLTNQGRMHRDIAEFCNLAFYGGKLNVVPLEHQLKPNIMANSDNAIARMLTKHRISFVASEAPRLSQSLKTNTVEAEMIAATVYQIYLLTRDTFNKESTVGVIVPYRNQISTVRNAIDRFNISILHDITIDTVERYQGSQRDYIIYGFTIQQSYQLNFLTNNVFEEDGMVIDRKLNVAMTRARLNLVLIGNPVLLSENFTFHKLMEFVRSKGSYYDIPSEDYSLGDFYVADAADENDSQQSTEEDISM